MTVHFFYQVSDVQSSLETKVIKMCRGRQTGLQFPVRVSLPVPVCRMGKR